MWGEMEVSDLMTTAIGNWLKATADDAMGMEPGDRHMANEARKLLEAKDAEIERLTDLRKEDREDMQRLSDQVDYLSDENAKLRAVVDAAELMHDEMSDDEGFLHTNTCRNWAACESSEHQCGACQFREALATWRGEK